MSTAVATEPIVAANEDEKRKLASIERTLDRPGRARLIGPNDEEMIIPESLYSVLREAAHQLGSGNGIAILPIMQELTTQQAAELLNVSRPHVVTLVESGAIRHHMVGTHRRIYLRDLLDYKRIRDERTHAAIKHLGDTAQEDGVYDE